MSTTPDTLPVPPVGRLLTTTDAARLLGIHPATIRRMAARGDLPHRALPSGHRRYRRDDVLALLPEVVR